jgi:hypothetical protein
VNFRALIETHLLKSSDTRFQLFHFVDYVCTELCSQRGCWRAVRNATRTSCIWGVSGQELPSQSVVLVLLCLRCLHVIQDGQNTVRLGSTVLPIIRLFAF